jgi:hypothetical protein
MWIPCELLGLWHGFATCGASVERGCWRQPTAGEVFVARMSATPPPKDAFAVLMHARQSTCPPDDPWVTGVLYRAWLEHIDPSEPLWRIPYLGQVVRSGTAKQNFVARQQEHNRASVPEAKSIGFDYLIHKVGPEKMKWTLLDSKSGTRSEIREWANREEKRLIAEHGGVLRDMHKKLHQTLNLTQGGSGASFAGLDAFRLACFHKFQDAMEVYVRKNRSSLVPFAYTTDDGYLLGHALSAFRKGILRIGMPTEEEITAWAEALPCWQWNAVKAVANLPERIAQNSETTKEWWKNASDKDRLERVSQMKEGQNRPERLEANAEKARQWWKTASASTKETRAKRQLASLKRQREETPEKEAARLAKVNEATRRGYEARLEGLTPQERKKRETKHAADLRGHRKRQADLKLLRTVMPDAKIKDIARAKREGWMPEAAK